MMGSQARLVWLSSGAGARFASAARAGHCTARCASARAAASSVGSGLRSMDQATCMGYLPCR